MIVAEQILNGVQFGIMLFLMASGLTLIFGVMNLINLAHGSLYMIGAFIAAATFNATHSFLAAIAAALAGAAVVGIAIEIVVFRTLYRRDHLDQVLATFGLLLFFNEVVRMIWGATALYAQVPNFLSGQVNLLPGAPYPTYRLAIIGVGLIVGLLTFIPSHHQSASFVFGHYENATGWSSPIYVAAIGLLLAQYTFCGYDASAHLSEETTQAQVNAARGIVRSIWVSWIAGFVLLAGLTFAIQDYAGTVNTTTGVPPAQIFLDALGSGGAKALLLVVIMAQLFCGNAEVAAASRMVFAFSRDRALPFSTLWRRVNERTRTPVPAVWLAVAVPFVLALPSLWSATAYGAVTAINVIGITPAYAIPIYLRLRAGKRFPVGPWNLGRWSKPIGWVAVVYVAIITLIFLLPQAYPVDRNSFNYAPVALLVVLLLAWVTWLARGRAKYSVPVYGSVQEREEMAEEIV